jgi:hypothetical protein
MNLKGKLGLIPLLLLPVLIVSSCFNGPANQPPVVNIDSISPQNPSVGEEIVFEGQATDEDGQIVSVLWRSSMDDIIGKTASFKTSSLSEGEHEIYFMAFDDDGASSEVMIKLVVSAELLAQPPPEPVPPPSEEPTEVTAQMAEEKVVTNVIEPLTLDGPFLGFRLKETLKPGDTVAPYGGQGQKLKKESYFYLIDLAPGAFYAHEVLFVTVDKNGGNMGVSTEEWWPVINGELPDFLSSREAYWNGDNWFYSQDIIGPVGPQEVTPGQYQAPATQQQYREAAVVVNGLTADEALTWEAAMSAWRMSVLFETFLAPEDVFELVPPPVGSNTPGDLFDLLSSLCEEGYNHISVYVIGHGGINVMKIGGLYLTASDLVRFLESHPDTNFSFLLESCHVGSFIDDLKELPNVFLVLTATSTYFSAYGDVDNEVDPNPDIDSGGEWSSSMYFSALEQLSYDNWINILTEAHRLDAPPSLILMLSAFSNSGYSDELGLDAAYLSNEQFPQVYSPWTPFCDLWQRPPTNGEVRFGANGRCGYVTSAGNMGSDRDSYPVGPRDRSRVFHGYYFPSEIPAESTVLNAYMHIILVPPVDCEPGYLGDLVVEHLDYGYLDRSDYSLPAEEVAVVPVWYETEGEDIKYTISITHFVQGDFENGRGYSQYRMRFTGDVELSIRSAGYADMTIHYELR